MAMGDSLPTHRATSQHLSVVNPFCIESGIIDPRTKSKMLGIPRGYCGRDGSGGLFCFDELEAYRAGAELRRKGSKKPTILNNGNTKRFGMLNKGKSGEIKIKIRRGAALGYNHLVTDRKGEYTPLANSIEGSQIIRFGGDSTFKINALGEEFDLGTQHEIVESMVSTAMRLDALKLDVVRSNLLFEGIKAAHLEASSSGRLPILSDLLRLLRDPTDEMAKKMYVKKTDIVGVGGLAFEMAHGLSRLTERDLRGVFDGPTSMNFGRDIPLLVMNLENIKGEAIVLMIILINFFTQSLWARENPAHRFHHIIHDEAWDLAAYPGFLDSVVRSFKLGGTWGVCNDITAHHKSNYDRSGLFDAIKALMADSDITICYQMDPKEVEDSAAVLNLSEAEAERIPNLPDQTALFKIGNLPGIEVVQKAWPEELPLLETRHLYHGKTDLERAPEPEPEPEAEEEVDTRVRAGV
jgi:hypothetical protein